MADVSNNNTDKLIGRIIDTARDEAADILNKAREENGKAELIAKDEIFSVEKGAALRADREGKDIVERSRTNAELDARKYALKARREVLDEAFSTAKQSLIALSGDRRAALLERMLLSEAEGGETVAAAAADEKLVFGELLASANKKLEAEGKSALVPGGVAAGIAGGFILCAAGYEKNCSFEALIRDVRTVCEGEVASVLFN